MDSKSELLKTVESQQEKLHKYETKLKDLVTAYKSQLKENQTLQSTIKSLTLKKSTAASKQAPTDGAESVASDGGETDGEETNADDELQKEIERLTQSVTELMQEKQNVQQAALAERRYLKLEYEEKLERLTTDYEHYKEESSKFSAQATEARSKLKTEQMDREREQTDHACMLRELNTNLSKLMTENEDFKHQVNELQQEALIRSQQPEPNDQYELIISDLTNQISDMKIQIRDAENRQQQQSLMNDLKSQIDEMKQQHQNQVQKEQQRGDEAEKKLEEIARQSEDRVSELENKLSHLSEMVGNYERLRFNDQQNINQLKERVSQLDQENTTLARVARPEVDSNLTIDELIDKFKNLKSSLKTACSENSTLDYLHVLSELFIDETRLHAKCDAEYLSLKDEYEKYKLRAQSVLKNKSKDSGSGKEVEDLRNTITELRDKQHKHNERNRQEQNKLETIIQDLRSSIANLQLKHERDLHTAEAEYQQKLLESEQSLTQHRERTVGLLAERERDIERLKNHLAKYSQPSSPPLDQIPSSRSSESSIDQLLSPTEPSVPLIHLQAEVSRQHAELTSLRRLKRQLESEVNELNNSLSIHQEQYRAQLALLKEEIQRLERNQNREGTNLEYLKNVVYQFIITHDTTSKMSIFNAISLMLHFSPAEKKTVASLLTGVSSAGGYLPSFSTRK